jgi:hypothetical protein
MHNENRAFWMTLLFYTVAGPLVGLFCLVVMSFFVAAWGGQIRFGFSGLDFTKLSAVVIFA